MRGVVVLVTLSETSVLLSDGGKTTSLTPLVNGSGDPRDPGVATDGLVVRVNKDNLVVLINQRAQSVIKVGRTFESGEDKPCRLRPG